MARVIHMQQSLADDVAIDLGSVRYAIPGDTPALTMMTLASIQDELAANQRALHSGEKTEGLGLRQIELVTQLDAEILGLLRIRQPDLVATGLSSEQLGWLLGAILTGFQDSAEEDSAPVRSRAKRAPARKAAATT